MIRFNNDYNHGTHASILEALEEMNGVREVLMRSESILVMLMVQDLDIGFPVMNVMSL